MVAVPETVGVHWKTCSGEPPELPQLPASRLVPLVVPVNVPPCAEMTVGLVQLPARMAGASGPWQTPRPSVLQRLSICLLHAKWRPPPATHEAISSPHACRHCLASETASAAGAMRSTASTASGAVNRRVLPPCLIPCPPRVSPKGAEALRWIAGRVGGGGAEGEGYRAVVRPRRSRRAESYRKFAGLKATAAAPRCW